MNPLSPIEESKPDMCLSPQEKQLKSKSNKRSSLSSSSSANDAKKARLDDMFKQEFEMDLDGWISDDYLRAMDFDDRLSQDIDWVAHDEMDLALGMDVDHTTSDDFGFGLGAFEDSTEMASTFVDPAYIRLETSNTKDAEKLLMSFDTMKFKIPSPTNTSCKKRSSSFTTIKEEPKQVEGKTASSTTGAATAGALAANSAAAEELRKEQARVAAASSLASTLSINTSSADSLLSVLNVGSLSPKSSSTEKKIGSYSPAARKLRLQKFHEKRKNRTWKKSIKYDCRKKLADDRPRIKGRFVRVLENAGDAKTTPAPCSASPPSSTAAGYASPTSSTGAMAPPVMAPTAKPQVSAVPRVAATCASTLASGSKPTPSTASVVKPAPVPVPTTSAAAALPFARMIASV